MGVKAMTPLDTSPRFHFDGMRSWGRGIGFIRPIDALYCVIGGPTSRWALQTVEDALHMIQWVVEKLIALIGPISALRKENRELADNALRAISHALNETYLYYRDIERGKERNPEVEAQLSRYWSAAAIPIRHIDRGLAQTCERKSEYWLNPDTWDEAKVTETGIGLDDVRKKYRALLGPVSVSRPMSSRPVRHKNA